MEEKVFTVENWLETAYCLCKQRWDDSIEWLETQPVSKILTMVDITNKVAERQEQEMKKSSRKR